jgi:hypothetical protein
MVQLTRLSFTLPRGIQRGRQALVCCCLTLAQILFAACNHVSTTNVNSPAPNVNVSPDPRNQVSLKAKVEALENQPLGPSSLGAATAFESPNVIEIIAEGENAVPFLIDALKQEKKPVLVGYAAYCLRQIKTDKGKDPAVHLYQKYYKKRERLTDEEPFAFNQLTHYLIEISAVPDDMRPPGYKPQ